jgi:agmatine deiminase
MKATVDNDPNVRTLQSITEQLEGVEDARGRKLRLVNIPSPGRVIDEEGQTMPASYLNFYIGNRCVVVPTFGSIYDRSAMEGISAFFPGRRTFGLRANAILQGGGAFHCITLTEPL